MFHALADAGIPEKYSESTIKIRIMGMKNYSVKILLVKITWVYDIVIVY